MSGGDAETGRVLLAIARESVEHAVRGTPEQGWDAGWLFEPGATFVTLRASDGRLRGCLGTLEATRPLIEDLRHNARAVASRDPRFAPVGPDELPGIDVEVSLLSPLEEVEVASEDEAVAMMAEGRDGWFLARGPRSGTFLPQVWDAIPAPRAFLRRLKEKAGLGRDFWDGKIRLWRYRVRKWTESGLREPPS